MSTLGTVVENVLESVSDAFVALDAQWRYVYVNRRAGELFGRRPEDLIGRHIWTEFPEGVGQTFYHAYHRAMEEQTPITLEDYYPPWDRWFENRIHPSPDGLSIFFHDITDRKRAELALAEEARRREAAEARLRASEARLRAIVDGSSSAIWVVDLQGRMVVANQALADVVGRPLGEIEGRFTHEFLPPEVARRGLEVDGWMIERNAPLAGEEEIELNGRRRTYLIQRFPLRAPDGEIVEVAGMATDITDRVEVEQRLRERERQLAEAQAVAHIGSFEYDVAADRVSWSDELYRIYGLEPGEFEATLAAFAERLHPDDREATLATIRRALEEGGSFRMRERVVRPDGEIRHLQSWGEVRTDERGRPLKLLGICQDVTDERRREDALRESEERFRTLVENVRGHCLIPLAADGRIAGWNRGAERLLGFREDEMLDQPVAALCALADSPLRAERALRIAVEDGRYEEDSHPIRTAAGRIWADVMITPLRDRAGALTGFSLNLRDSTERREAELRRERLTERLRTLHRIDLAILRELSPETIAKEALERLERFVPFDHGSVTVLEDGEERLVASVPAGAPPPAEAGSRLEESLAPDGLPVGRLTLLARQPGAFDAEAERIAREIADQLAIAVRHAALRERVRAHADELEAKVAARTAELEAVNADLEAFAYSVAHDLRAPLRAVQGLTQALTEDYADALDDVGRDYARRIVAAAQRMDVMIQDLLAYARLSRSEPRLEPVALDRVMSEVLAQLEGEIGESRAHVEVQEDLPAVLGHRATLVQVVGNLLSNALKFVAPGERPRVRVTAEREGGEVRLTVADEGIGIDPAHQSRIFRVFERLHGHERYPGTGIGLAIVRKGMDRMNGHATVESAPGEGSRFTISLPAASA